MSLTYQQLLHDTALRLNALVGAQFGPLQTTYTKTTLLAADFRSADWPFDSFRDAILMAEEQLAWAIAGTPNHPWRAFLNAQTAVLVSGVALPAVDSASHPIIGVYGGVVDGITSVPCFMQPLEVVRRIIQETWRIVPIHAYAMDGNRIYHTRTNVKLNVCIYDRVTQLTAWNAAGNTVLPDVLEAVITALAISLMTRDNSYEAQATVYAKYAQQAIMAITAGAVTVPTLPEPSQIVATTAG